MPWVGILLGSLFMLRALSSTAQEPSERAWSSAYVELLGIAGWYSLNYEYRSGWWAVRGGLSAWNGQNGPVLATPISALVIVDPGSARTLEFGAGYVPSWGERTYDRNGSGHAAADLETYTFDHWPAFQFGYRSQSGPGRILFRANLTVMHMADVRARRGLYPAPDVQLWFGASLGYTFK